jgi:uncharacterized protein (TIGR03083 family)
MEPAVHIDHLRADSAALLAAHAADPAAPVPSCPGWDRTSLLAHVAGVHSWVRAQAEAGPAERVRVKETPRPPEAVAELPGWFEANASGLALALEAMDTSIEWPTWAGPQPGTFYPRRMAQETAVHRWDGAGGPIDAALAVDGVDELLELFAWLIPTEKLTIHGTIHLHATDADGEWLVRISDAGIAFEHGHAKGDVALRGGAGDLLLWVWNRAPIDDRFEVFGDPALLEQWRTAVTF